VCRGRRYLFDVFSLLNSFFCLIFFAAKIHPWLIIVNVLVAPFDGLEGTIYHILFDTVIEILYNKC